MDVYETSHHTAKWLSEYIYMIGANLYSVHCGDLLRPIIIFISSPLPLRIRHALASTQLCQVALSLSLTHTHNHIFSVD
jgi:hypothetical protein